MRWTRREQEHTERLIDANDHHQVVGEALPLAQPEGPFAAQPRTIAKATYAKTLRTDGWPDRLG